MEGESPQSLSFFSRLGLAVQSFWRAVTNPSFAQQLTPLVRPQKPAQPKALPPEKVHASGLNVLALLQRDGRLVDFLQEDVASFSDADIGAAARVVHAGCRKALRECLTLEPALNESEGANVTVPAGFDAQRIRLTGNVVGQPPFRGTLKHHGWVATAIRLPAISEAMDPRVLAPAEIEL